jgi:hypothetical protein
LPCLKINGLELINEHLSDPNLTVIGVEAEPLQPSCLFGVISMKYKPQIVLALMVGIHLPFPSWAKTAIPSDDLKVVIIRHGEKPGSGDNLSCLGESRALQLPAVLYKEFNAPAFSYIPSLA